MRLADLIPVILTRFSRVTFNAAHNYLGLTTEVLRTEKAINDIACHPLPPSFYEGGGLRHLRQRFDGVTTSDSDNESDYFSYPASSNSPSRSSSIHKMSLQNIGTDPNRTKDKAESGNRASTPFKGAAARQFVQAGDLHTSATTQTNEGVRPHARSRSSLYTPMPPPGSPRRNVHGVQRLSTVDFDLRDEVMSCIAKSIGLLQPPLSGEESVEASPAFPPSDASRSRPGSAMFGSSFGSLTLLGMGDDASSEMTASSTGTGDGYLSGLDNEVEILFFPAGSTLAKAGDMNTGTSLLVCSWYIRAATDHER
jgi:lysophospholipid hydrolase